MWRWADKTKTGDLRWKGKIGLFSSSKAPTMGSGWRACPTSVQEAEAGGYPSTDKPLHTVSKNPQNITFYLKSSLKVGDDTYWKVSVDNQEPILPKSPSPIDLFYKNLSLLVTLQNDLQMNLHTKGKRRGWVLNIQWGTAGKFQTFSEVFVAQFIVLASSTR